MRNSKAVPYRGRVIAPRIPKDELLDRVTEELHVKGVENRSKAKIITGSIAEVQRQRDPMFSLLEYRPVNTDEKAWRIAFSICLDFLDSHKMDLTLQSMEGEAKGKPEADSRFMRSEDPEQYFTNLLEHRPMKFSTRVHSFWGDFKEQTPERKKPSDTKRSLTATTRSNPPPPPKSPPSPKSQSPNVSPRNQTSLRQKSPETSPQSVFATTEVPAYKTPMQMSQQQNLSRDTPSPSTSSPRSPYQQSPSSNLSSPNRSFQQSQSSTSVTPVSSPTKLSSESPSHESIHIGEEKPSNNGGFDEPQDITSDDFEQEEEEKQPSPQFTRPSLKDFTAAPVEINFEDEDFDIEIEDFDNNPPPAPPSTPPKQEPQVQTSDDLDVDIEFDDEFEDEELSPKQSSQKGKSEEKEEISIGDEDIIIDDESDEKEKKEESNNNLSFDSFDIDLEVSD